MAEILITDLSWGQMIVSINGERQTFKDCKIWPGGARAWNWKETGTEHNPGIQPADFEEILDYGVDVIILTQGVVGRLSVSKESKDYLRQRNIPFHIEKTNKAVALFNEFSQTGKRVGGIFHSTC